MRPPLKVLIIGAGTGGPCLAHGLKRAGIGLEDETKFEKKFSHYVHEESGAVTAFFEDGSSATGDLLVGADGAIVSIGGKVPLTEETRTLLSEKVLLGISLVMASKGMGAILAITSSGESGPPGKTTRKILRDKRRKSSFASPLR